MSKEMGKDKLVIISLGGSLVVPNGGIDVDFLRDFSSFIRKKIAKGWRFFIVVGGGATARHYIKGASDVVGKISDWDLDWLGIHTTRLNAHLIKTIFQDVAHPRVIANYEKKIVDLKEPLVVASGWKPGCSTDYDAVYLAREYGVEMLVNMSNIDSVYDKDPNRYKDARPIRKINWGELVRIVGDRWSPGSNLPFGPMAAKQARKLNLNVYVIGKDLDNLDKVLKGDEFVGTLISSK